MILEIWKIVTDSVDDLRVVNTDAISNLVNTPENFLQELVRTNKNMYLEAFFQKCLKHPSPFITSFDRLLDVEAADTLKRIASRLITKWQ